VYIAEEIRHNRFRIAGGVRGLRVSWQVTGIRHDAYAEQNRIPVEIEKSSLEQGKYRSPEAFGLAPDLGMLVPVETPTPQLVGTSHADAASGSVPGSN
jgi:hypothetical protein